MLIGYFVIAVLVVFIDALFCAYAQRRFRLVLSLVGALVWPLEMVCIIVGTAYVNRNLPEFSDNPDEWRKF